MKKLNSLLLLLFAFTHLFANELFPFEQNGKSGYRDAAGRIIIAAKYDNAKSFLKNGLAKVGILEDGGWKYGFIDTLGKEIIPIKYNRVGEDFYAELVEACQDGKCGFLNKSGQTVVPLKYSAIDHFYEGLAAVYLNKKWGFIDPAGAVKVRISYDEVKYFAAGRAAVKLNNKWGFIDYTGNVIIPLIYEDVTFEGFINALSGVRRDGKWAVINRDGEVLTPFTYNGIHESFGTDLISVYRTEGGGGWLDKTTFRYGLVNSKGQELIPLQYDYLMILSNELMQVRVGDNEGIINTKNKIVLPIKYKQHQVTVYSDWTPQGIIVENGVRKVFSLEGSGIRIWKYEHVNGEYEGMRSVLYKNKWGFINQKGQETVAVKYDSVGIFSDGYAQVALGGKIGFVDVLGNERVKIKYNYATPFSGGVSWVQLNGKIGAIDKAEKEIIAIKYDEIMDFKDNMAPVSINNKWGFIDDTGKEVVPVIYEQIGYFSEGLAPVALNKKIGFINPQGKVVIELQFDGFVGEFNNGRAKVIKNGKEIYIDKSGREIK